jgi:hypothetical protein
MHCNIESYFFAQKNAKHIPKLMRLKTFSHYHATNLKAMVVNEKPIFAAFALSAITPPPSPLTPTCLSLFSLIRKLKKIQQTERCQCVACSNFHNMVLFDMMLQ